MQSSAQTKQPFLCLLDLGATGCWISQSETATPDLYLPCGSCYESDLAGNFTANEEIKLHNILLPEFHKIRRIQTLVTKKF